MEHDQLVNQKMQITQQQLRERAAAAGVEIELLPGRMWCRQHTGEDGPVDRSHDGLEGHGH